MSNPAIIVHGGCGPVDKGTIPDRLDGLKAAAEAGWRLLRTGGSAGDAVEAAVVVLEDNPLFNAGRGSVLNSEGRVETDAAIMDGSSRAAGAIAGVTGFLNPVKIARRVMETSPHVMLISVGAEEFARAQGFTQYGPEALVADYRRREWEKEHGTVGAAACDTAGHVAAATSTGGSTGKLPGRVGDSPIIGAGTYADAGIAVSCTGNGEHIIRMTLARLAAFLYQEREDAQAAVHGALADLEDTLGGEVGLIVADRLGKVGFAKNSLQMPVCAISMEGLQAYY